MNKYFIPLGVLALGATHLFADVQLVQQQYRFYILNQTVNISSEIVTLKDIQTIVKKELGYDLFNQVQEITPDKKFIIKPGTYKLGEVLDKILEGTDAVVDVNEKKQYIKIIYPEYAYIDLPFGWNLMKTKKSFEEHYPYVHFYVAGNRLTAYGLPQDLIKLAPVMQAYQKKAFEKVRVFVNVYPYCTTVQNDYFLGKRKYHGSEEYKPLKSYSLKVMHGDKINVSYGNINVNFTFDKQDKAFYLYDMKIPVKDLNKVGFVFRLKYNKPSTFLDKVFGASENGQKCKDAIITINYAPNVLAF